MALDPQVQQHLDQLAAMNLPALEDLTPQQARQFVVAEAESFGTPEPIASMADFKVPGVDGEVPIRTYAPRNGAPLPALVYYHGGGWVLGDVETHDGICCELANRAECMVVSVDYRLAPEHKYPAAVDDAYAATAWVFEQAAQLGIDPRRIAVGGDSAGGNLATAVALMARDRAAFRPAYQVLVYPVTDCNFDTPSYYENAEGYQLTREAMRWFWAQYLTQPSDGRQPYASPLRAESLGNLPPALVLTAEYDPLRDEGEAYARRLEEAGVPVTLTRYPGMIHGFFRRTHQFDQARAAVTEVAETLKRAFGTVG